MCVRLPTGVFGKNMGNMGIFRAKIWDIYGILALFWLRIWDIYGTFSAIYDLLYGMLLMPLAPDIS